MICPDNVIFSSIVHQIMEKTLQYDSVPILDWLLSDGFHISPLAYEKMVTSGQFEMVQLLNKCYSDKLQVCHDEYICACAAKSGNLVMMKWLIKNYDIKLTFESTCGNSVANMAAEHGHVHILKWLHQKYGKLEFNYWSIKYAYKGGNLAILDYIYQNNLKFWRWDVDRDDIKYILEQKQKHVIEWLLNHNLVNSNTVALAHSQL
jgi:hypothetical protein